MRKTLAFISFIIPLSSFASTGTVDYYLAPSRRYLDWSTPKSITRTFAGSRIRAHELNPLTRKKTAMGHGMIHFKCTLPSGKEVEAWSGLSGQSDAELSKALVIKKKIGISVLFYPFQDGYIQSEEEVRGTISSYRGRKERDKDGLRRELQPVFLRKSITPEVCEKVNAFYEAFKAKSFGHSPTAEELVNVPVNQRLLFGLNLDPYELYVKNGPQGVLGGGCTSYGAAYLKLIGLYNSEWAPFIKRDLYISPQLMGDEKNPASIISIIFGELGNSWDHGDENLHRLSFFDSEKIWDFYDSLSACSGDKESFAGCTDEVSGWISSQGLQAVKIREEVTGEYKGKSFKNTVRGVELIDGK